MAVVLAGAAARNGAGVADWQGEGVSEIRFRASLPAIKSAILLDGHGDGGQVKLEVPRSDVGALLLLQNDYAGKSFMVTIEAIDDELANKPRKLHI